MDFLNKLLNAKKEGLISDAAYRNFKELYDTYEHSMLMIGKDMKDYVGGFEFYLARVKEQIQNPHVFEPFHKKVTYPHNYFQFGIDFMRPLVDKEKSKILHPSNIKKMVEEWKAKENVILYANHQTETDPQLLTLALEENYPEFASELIFVAGDRVITDPMAVPFSLGCNLLCIYSKRHIDNPPEKKEEKLQHNQRTMKRMKELLSTGGKCIYVAPSGGRDRPNENGEVFPAPFDPQSVEMFRLMALQSQRRTHFYPLALATFDILPPPQTIKSDLGEVRHLSRQGAHFSFGDEIDMDHFPGDDVQVRHARREARSQHIWNLVNHEYALLKQTS